MFDNIVRNVVIVCDYGYIEGGAARIAHETAIALKQNGYNVVFFCAVGPVSKELTESGIKIICLNQNDILHETNRFKAIFQGIDNKTAKIKFSELLDNLNSNETIIHVHTWTKGVSSSIFKVAEKKGFNVVITVHDYFLICPNGGLFNYKASKICHLKPMSTKCICCNCDARSYLQKLFRVVRQYKQNRNIRKRKNISYIFISEFSKREFFKRYNKIPESKQYFLPNMINFPSNRERVKCEENDTYLFIGGITEVKGIRIFCEAVTSANVEAVVIGQGILKDELEKKYPNVAFVGWKSKEEMEPYIQKARCLIFPSIWYETMGLVVLEIMAYGIPIICSDLCAASEYIIDNLNGMLYDGNSIKECLKVVEKMQESNNVKLLSQECYRAFNPKNYSPSTYIENLIAVYVEIGLVSNKDNIGF